MAVLSDACAEWRQLASCRVDGELSETDAARLRRHLRTCPSCVSWLADVDATTALLRSAGDTVPGRRLDLPAIRRRTSRAAAFAAAAAAAAAMALVILPQWSVSPDGSQMAASGSLPVRGTWDHSHAVLQAGLELWPVPAPHHVASAITPS